MGQSGVALPSLILYTLCKWTVQIFSPCD